MSNILLSYTPYILHDTIEIHMANIKIEENLSPEVLGTACTLSLRKIIASFLKHDKGHGGILGVSCEGTGAGLG